MAVAITSSSSHSSIPAASSASPAFTSSRHAAQAHASSSSSSAHPYNSLQPSSSEGGLVFSTQASPSPSPRRPSSSKLQIPSAPSSSSSSSSTTTTLSSSTSRTPLLIGSDAMAANGDATKPPSSRRTRASRSDRDPLFQPIPDSTSFGSGGAAGKSWGVALHPPAPQVAPALTLSYRSMPDPTQFPSFASLLRSMPQQSRSRKVFSPSNPVPLASSTKAPTAHPTTTAPASVAATSAADVSRAPAASQSRAAAPTATTNLAEATPAPSLTSTHPSSPATFDAPDLAASVVTEATSVADADPASKGEAAASSGSTPQAGASPVPKKVAWAAPKSWAELASRGSAGRQPVVGVSVNFNEAPSAPQTNGPEAGSPSRSPRAATGTKRKGGGATDGASKQQQASMIPVRPAIMSLERLLADSHKYFNAPLTHPRGLVNTGNFCFANAILQMLVYCAPFYNLFTLIGREVPADFGNTTPLMEAVIHFLREFVLVDAHAKPNGNATLGADEEDDMVSSFAPGASEPFVPEFVYDAMRLNKRFDLMRRGHQEDAEEFLGFFLDTLHEELLSAMRRSAAKLAQSGSGAHSLLAKMGEEEKRLNGITDEDLKRLGVKVRGDAGGASSVNGSVLGLALAKDAEVEEREVTRPVSPSEEGWMEVGQKGKTAFTRTTSTSDSPITRIFGGKLRSVLKCPGAKDSVTLEPYQPLQLDIQPPHVQSIEDALFNLTVPEVIPGVYSPAKGTHIDATKQVFIESLPPILIVHLKRFVYDEVGGVQKSQKPLAYGTTLEIAGEVLSPAMRAQGKPKYKLFGVVYHHGRYASGGHYTVDVLRQDNRSWLHIDDTTYHTIPTEHVVRTSGKSSAGHDGLAYLLFYKRDDGQPAPQPQPTSHAPPLQAQPPQSPRPKSTFAPTNGSEARRSQAATAARAAKAALPAIKAPEKATERKRTVPGWSK
ncbi:hypothetical protein ACQY0O_006667 [Thecaphora frezii]